MKRLACLLLLAFVAVAPQARAEDVAALMERHIAWRGGPAYERLQSVRTESEVQAAGLKGRTSEWRERAGRTRDELSLGPLDQVSAVAEDSWSMTGGVVEVQPETQVRDTRRITTIGFADVLRGRGAQLSLLGKEPRDGRSWQVVRVGYGDADTYDLFLDGSSGALHGYRIVEDGRERFIRLSDWRIIDGVRMPFALEQIRSDGSTSATIRVQRLWLNERFDPAIYKRPASRRVATFADGARSTGPIRFDFFNGARTYVPVTVNGHPVAALLDSGADFTVVDKTFADRIGLKYTGQSKASGTGGETDAHFAERLLLQVGNMQLDLRNVGVIDLSDVSKRLGIPLPIVIGEEVFNQLIVDIDYDKAEIAFHDPDRYQPPEDADQVELAQAEGIRSVPVEVEGHERIYVDFDLGNGNYFTLDPAFYETHGLLKDRPHSTIMGGAVGGAREEKIATVRSLRFAGLEFRDVPTAFTQPVEGRPLVGSSRVPGNMGLSILARFRVITDYANDRLYLVPRPDTVTRPFRKDRAGLQTVVEGGRLKVTWAAPGSPAAAGGWKAGEEITAIDGKAVTAGYDGSELSRWRFGAAGKTVRLTLADGSHRTLVLKDYF